MRRFAKEDRFFTDDGITYTFTSTQPAHARKESLREHLSTVYGLRFSKEIYESKQEKTVFHEYLQEHCFVLTEISKKNRKTPEVYGRM